MGGYSGGADPSRQITPERISSFMQSDNPLARMATHFLSNTDFGSKLQGIFGQLGQLGFGGQGQQQPAGGAGQPAGGQPSGSAYPGFRMPAYTYHTSLPQFNLNNPGGFTPATSTPQYNYNSGGALNLPGWALQQQAGNTPTAGNWRPSVTTDNQNNGGGGGQDAAGILQQGYGYLPGQGFISLTPEQRSTYEGQRNAATPRMPTSNPDLFLQWLMQNGGTPYGAQAAATAGVGGTNANGPGGMSGSETY